MLAVRDGVLFTKWESEKGDDISWKLVLPNSLRTDILTQLHDSPAAGHFQENDRAGESMFLLVWSTKRC